jgi:hypothetical protein
LRGATTRDSMKSVTAGVPSGRPMACCGRNMGACSRFVTVVAPGLGLGYTASGAGGYQQLSVNEFARPRSTDELRPANRPKVTYAQPVVKGAHFVPLAVNKDELGSGTQARPPRYYSNPSGERNFVTTGDTVAPARRGAVVLQDVTRPETTTPYGGVAGLVDGGASYEVPSTHAPMHRQHGPYGWRNADASTYGDADTSKFANDHGRSGVHFDANQRSVTGTTRPRSRRRAWARCPWTTRWTPRARTRCWATRARRATWAAP